MAYPPPYQPPASAASIRMGVVTREYAAAQTAAQALYERGRALEDAMGEFRARNASSLAEAPLEELTQQRAAVEEYKGVLDDLNRRALPHLERAVAEHLALTHTAPQRRDAAARWAADCDVDAGDGEEGGTAFVNAMVQKHLTAFPAPTPTAPNQIRHCANCGTGPAELSIHPAASVTDPTIGDDVCCQGVSNLCFCIAGRTHACCEACWTSHAAIALRDNVRLLATGQTAPPPCCVRCIVCNENVCVLRLAKNTPAPVGEHVIVAPAPQDERQADQSDDFFNLLGDITDIDDMLHQSDGGPVHVGHPTTLGGLVHGSVPTQTPATAAASVGLPGPQPYSSGIETTPSGSGPTSPVADASMAALFPALETLGGIFDAVIARTKKTGTGVDAFVKKLRAELDFAGRLGGQPMVQPAKRTPNRRRQKMASPPSATGGGVTKRRKSGVRHCTSCGEAGHYKNRCPAAEERNLLAEVQADVDRTPPPPPPQPALIAGEPPQQLSYGQPLPALFPSALPDSYPDGDSFNFA